MIERGGSDHRQRVDHVIRHDGVWRKAKRDVDREQRHCHPEDEGGDWGYNASHDRRLALLTAASGLSGITQCPKEVNYAFGLPESQSAVDRVRGPVADQCVGRELAATFIRSPGRNSPDEGPRY